MDMQTPERKKLHQGLNLRRWRKRKDVTQDEIAELFDISQQAVSDMEKREELKEEQLEKIAERLNITVDTLKYVEPSDEGNPINNSFTVNDTGVASGGNNKHDLYYINCTFNPLDKVTELYERLLEMEREKNKK